MKLIPKAKPIRIRISSGGEEHSSLDTLLQQYDIETMLSLYKNGSLIRWLNQIGASAIVEMLSNLKVNNFDAITNEEYIKFVSAIYGGDTSDIAYKIANYYQIKENCEQILRWHDIAYKYGNMDSAYELGLIYKNGLYGVKESAHFAFTYFSIAADRGHRRAQLFLSALYEEGDGVEQSNEQAIKYLEMAANANFVDAYLDLGRILFKVERYDEAEKWLKLALENENSEHPDYVEILLFLGHLYFEKDKNNPKVYEYYHKAAISGSSLAKHNLGCLYKDGIGGVSQDENQSLYWYRSAAKDGYAQSQYAVGEFLYHKNYYVNAIIWLDLAIKQDHIPSKRLYAQCLIRSNKNLAKAYNLMIEAAKENDTDAKYYMGMFYDNGYYVRKDINKAIDWYKKAAEDGEEFAINRLIELGETTFSVGLFEVARKFKIGKQIIVDFLNKNGYRININDISLNTKLNKEMYDLVVKEFGA